MCHVSLFSRYSVKRLQYATEMFLVKHGIECVNKHVNLRNIANIMTDCYAMTAVLGKYSPFFTLV